MNAKNPTTVLLIEDNPADAVYVQELLPIDLYDVSHSSTLADAYKHFGERPSDLILLDLSLAESQGLDTFLSIKGMAPAIPILILTGLDDETVAVEAMKLGAQDYILKKEITARSLHRLLVYALERMRWEQNNQRLALLEQREEFMATLTHDLKNPLIGANRVLELMAQASMGTISPEHAKLLLKLRDSNKLLLSMIQNLVEVYRFEKDVHSVILENIDLRNIVSSCIADIAPIAENRQIELVINAPEQHTNILADKSAIRRVVQNLLDNALKFTPDGGSIDLKLRRADHCVVLEVHDTGPGISEEEQSKLFQRFWQGTSGRKYTPGTGLGLYLCKQIVDAHHGQITCLSSAGGGTTFKVTVPELSLAPEAGQISPG